MQINRKQVNFYLGYIRRGRHFEVNLQRYGQEITDAVLDDALTTFVDPLLIRAERAMLYWIHRRHRTIRKSYPKPPLPEIWLSRTSEMFEIDLSRARTVANRPFWRFALRGMDDLEANLVLCIKNHKLPLQHIASYSWDPHYLTTPSRGASAEALKLCKLMARSKTHTACLFTRTALGLSLSFQERGQTATSRTFSIAVESSSGLIAACHGR